MDSPNCIQEKNYNRGTQDTVNQNFLAVNICPPRPRYAAENQWFPKPPMEEKFERFKKEQCFRCSQSLSMAHLVPTQQIRAHVVLRL